MFRIKFSSFFSKQNICLLVVDYTFRSNEVFCGVVCYFVLYRWMSRSRFTERNYFKTWFRLLLRLIAKIISVNVAYHATNWFSRGDVSQSDRKFNNFFQPQNGDRRMSKYISGRQRDKLADLPCADQHRPQTVLWILQIVSETWNLPSLNSMQIRQISSFLDNAMILASKFKSATKMSRWTWFNVLTVRKLKLLRRSKTFLWEW